MAAFACLFCGLARAQSVTGTVVDETNQPLPGVNILVEGTQSGGITDANGQFRIGVGSSKAVTLRLSFIGYTVQHVKAVPGKTLRVKMEPDEQTLSEVVVTGYGTFKKSAYAGSASTLKMAGKADLPTTDFKQLLNGSTPGVSVNSSSGALGAATNVYIRGMGSINASTQPLYVVDGVPVMSSVSSGLDSGTDIMSTINPDDIENITVIKDAAAASLYGSRAANGVIVITTKQGREGKAVLNFRADWGWSNYATKYRPTMNGADRRQAFWDGLYNNEYYVDGKSDADARAYADAHIDEYAP
ncbi:MAG: TonB-dependent receptor plug domain-containing protein, partial [Tannerella sp.]|nr:TonB-dependent receptor plug domain-containing protein [Tannerella sp.]